MSHYNCFKYYFVAIGLVITANSFAYDSIIPTYKAGHPSLQKYLLPDVVPSPADNKLTKGRIELGKQMFWEPRLSGTGQSTCGWCHTPERGWSDGMKTGMREGGTIMRVASPTIVNLGYNKTFMWDGR